MPARHAEETEKEKVVKRWLLTLMTYAYIKKVQKKINKDEYLHNFFSP